MKSAALGQWTFSFLLGAIVGCFGVAAIGVSVSDDSAPESGESEAARVGSAQAVVLDGQALDPKSSDKALAAALESARFDTSWGAVEAVAHVLRNRNGRTLAASLGSGAQPKGPEQASLAKRSFLELSFERQRQAFLLDLRGRNNPATRAAKLKKLKEREGRLQNLFLTPPAEPQDAIVARDAATLLGLAAKEGSKPSREVLLRALEEQGLGQRAEWAARALRHADDSQVNALLIKALRRNPDPNLRARAVKVLAGSHELIAGGPVLLALVKAAQSDTNAAVRGSAIAALSRADLKAQPKAREALIRMVQDATGELSVRLAVLVTLKAHHALALSLPAEVVVSLEALVGEAEGALLHQAAGLLAVAGRTKSLKALEAASASARAADRAPLAQALKALRQRQVSAD